MSKFCPTCENYCETKTKTVSEIFKVKGLDIDASFPREQCVSCGKTLGSDEQDQQILDFVNAEYRKRIDLLIIERS